MNTTPPISPSPPQSVAAADAQPAGPALSATGLDKHFARKHAVKNATFNVSRGHIFGFLGPNGAGKTTVLRLVLGLLRPDSGEVRVLGLDPVRKPREVRLRIGYVSQLHSLYGELTVDENLRFFAGAYALPADVFAQRRAYILEMADLVGREGELTRNLSVGWRQRLALGTATIHEPDLLFLDEPTSGVDPVARRQFWDLLYDLAGRGVTLFVTTHYMEEASHCHRLAFIYRGRLIAEGSPRQIRSMLSDERVYDVTVADADLALRWLESADGVSEAYLSGAALHAVIDEPADIIR